MELKGIIDVNKDLKHCIDKISNLSHVIPCLPNLINYEIINSNSAKARFRAELKGLPPFLSYLSRITANVIINIDDIDYSNHIVIYSFSGDAAGLKYTGTINLHLKDNNKATLIEWSASVDLGKIASMLS
ncbi:MAG: SRPBCC domain-containing protein, partial [Thermoproteus sp.]